MVPISIAQQSPLYVWFCALGDPLQRLPEDPPVQPGHVSLRRLLPERGTGGGGSFSAAQRGDGDQAPQQHVHVPRQPGHEAHLPGLTVHSRLQPLCACVGLCWMCVVDFCVTVSVVGV